MKSRLKNILLNNGFVKVKHKTFNVQAYQKGDDPSTMLYAEIYDYGGWENMWIVGKGIPNKCWDAGIFIHTTEALINILKNIPHAHNEGKK